MKLETYLEKYGLSHSAFAELVQVSQASITRYCRGQRIPKPLIVSRIYELTEGAVTSQDHFDAYASRAMLDGCCTAAAEQSQLSKDASSRTDRAKCGAVS